MRAAFFDIDGVLTKGFVVGDFWSYLGEASKLNSVFLSKSKEFLDKYFKEEINYRDMAYNVVMNAALARKGCKQEDIRNLAKKFINSNKIAFFSYANSLIGLFKESGIETIAISGSDVELIENYKEFLGLDEIHGTEYKTSNGIYTGNVRINMALKESKEKILSDCERGGIDISQSFTFGDTYEDVAVLEHVGFPIALNPTDKLKRVASRRGWKILTEEDDVIAEVKKMLNVRHYL